MKYSFDDLKGRNCVITGGFGILGMALTRGLAEAGVNLAVISRSKDNPARGEAIAKEFGVKCLGISASTLDKAALEAARDEIHEKLGKIDILINCAGGNSPKATCQVEQMTKDDDLADTFYGLDIEMGTWTDGLAFSASNAYDKYHLAAPYQKMLKNGEIPVENINDKAARILKLMFRTSMNSHKPWGSFASEEHFNAGKTIAEEGIVLLKNEGALLPLANNCKNILVVGENAIHPQTPGGGSSELKVKVEVSPLEGLTKALGKDRITFAYGYTPDIPEKNGYVPFDRDSLFKDAVEKAGKADLVIFIGGLNKNWNQDCEGGDRFSYDLPYGQSELLAELHKANKKIVAVILSGNAYAMPWQKDIPAIVQGWYMGSASGEALADVLTGKTNPSGKLPFSFPKELEDCPAHHFGKISYPGDSVKVEYKEGILVGYRWYDTKKIVPRYGFGHGLSYTNFEYGKIQLDNDTYGADDKVAVKIPVRNVGTMAGKEVVQLYVKDNKSSFLRPEKELKAFSKITLEPGEEKTVTFTLDKKAWRYYDEKISGWNVEPGKFTILIGSSSQDIRQKASLTIEN